jgi:hypothetical protein
MAVDDGSGTSWMIQLFGVGDTGWFSLVSQDMILLGDGGWFI